MLDPNNELTLFIHDTLRFISAFIIPISKSAPNILSLRIIPAEMLLIGKVERMKPGHCHNSMDNIIFGNVNGPVYERESRDLNVQRKNALKFKASQVPNLIIRDERILMAVPSVPVPSPH